MVLDCGFLNDEERAYQENFVCWGCAIGMGRIRENPVLPCSLGVLSKIIRDSQSPRKAKIGNLVSTTSRRVSVGPEKIVTAEVSQQH